MATPPDDQSIVIYEVPITENQANQAVFCSGVAIAAKTDGTLHVVFYVRQPTVGGGTERAANLRVIMHEAAWRQGMDMITRAIGARAKEGGDGSDGESKG